MTVRDYRRQAMKKTKFMRRSAADKIILSAGYLLLGVFVLLIVVPLVYVVVASFMDPTTLNNEGITFDFSKWTFMGYERVLSNNMLWRGFGNAVLYSVSFTIISVLVTVLAAYPMSRPNLVGKKFFNALFIVTMFFNGGLIPTYLLISNLNMLDTIWAIILPNAFNVWNMILARTYYQSIPGELREASAVDGASDVVHFFKILAPVCKPIVAVLALYQFVGMWNGYFDAMIYLNDADKQPLQLVLRSILIQNTPEAGMIADIQSRAEMTIFNDCSKQYSAVGNVSFFPEIF